MTLSAGRDIVARIKASGDFRVSIECLGALTRSGTLSSDRAQTHLQGATAEEVARLMLEPEVLVGAAGVGAEDQLVGGDAQRER